MKKNLFIICLVAVTVFCWIRTITGVEDDEKQYIEQLKIKAENNEKEGLYKPNEKIYIELANYEGDIKWYIKLKEVYKKLGKSSKYEDLCEIIYEKFPSEKENTIELIKLYDEAGRSNVIMNFYNNNLSDEYKNMKDIKNIYYKYACQHKYKTSFFNGWIDSWGNYMLVNDDERYKFYLVDGGHAFNKTFEYADLFIDEYAAVRNEGEWYFIDKEGDKYINCNQGYEEVHSYSEGFAVIVKDGKYGYIDLDGREYSVKYDYATAMYNGVAAVKEGEHWYIINSRLEKISEDKYDDIIINSVGICSRKGIIFAKQGGKYSMIDLEGKIIKKSAFDDAKLFGNDELAAVMKNGRWGFVDRSGNVVIDYQYEDADTFSNGLAAVKVNGSYEYITDDGIVRSELRLKCATELYDIGYGVVETEDGYRIITFDLCHIGE